jgi:hypothetical protein
MESGVIVAICDEEIVIYHLIYLTKW